MITDLDEKTVEFKGITLTMNDLMCLKNVYERLSTMELIEGMYDIDLEIAWEIASKVRDKMGDDEYMGELEAVLINEEYEKNFE